jgi:hypothetical protein
MKHKWLKQVFENQFIITINETVINIELDHFNSIRTENGNENCCELFYKFLKKTTL